MCLSPQPPAIHILRVRVEGERALFHSINQRALQKEHVDAGRRKTRYKYFFELLSMRYHHDDDEKVRYANAITSAQFDHNTVSTCTCSADVSWAAHPALIIMEARRRAAQKKNY
jgi:hypothetical protein